MEDSASLRDALDACVFFSASMGRLGADFTALLPPLFEDKMHSLVVHFWKEGTSQLAETLKICREAGVASPLSSSTAVSTTLTTPGSDAAANADSGPMPPPRQLMALPPLGRVVNAFLTGLNELRRCLLPGIFSKLRVSMDEIMTEIEGILQSNERATMTPGLRGDAVELRARAKEMRQVMADIVVPYVLGALELSLGNEADASKYHDKLAEFLSPPPVEEEPEAEEEAEEEGNTADTVVEEEQEPKLEQTEPEQVVEYSEQVEEGGWNDGLEGMDELQDETP